MAASESAQSKSSTELNTISGEFGEQISRFQEATESQTGGLTEQIMRLVDNAPNYETMFRDDTADSRNEIQVRERFVRRTCDRKILASA